MDHLIQPFATWHSRRPLSELITCFCQTFGRRDHQRVKEQIWEELHTGHHYTIASRGDHVLGFISWRRWFEPRHRLAELMHIGTIRHHGVPDLGQNLVTAMEHEMHEHYKSFGYPGVRKVLLFTHADNRPAQRLYRRCGYNVLSDRHDHPVVLREFTRQGVDELMMIKDFPENRIASMS